MDDSINILVKHKNKDYNSDPVQQKLKALD